MFLASLFSKSLLFKQYETKIMKNMVYRYTPQRSAFDKTSYIEKYIPRPNKFHKNRKPRLAQWTDPKVQWPILLPPPTKLKGRSLLKHIEAIEKKRILNSRTFRVLAIRPGDVVQFTYYHSLSEKKFNVYAGLVIGRRKKKSLDASFRVLFRFCGSHVEMNVKQNSPFISDFKVLAKGKGHRRGKLYYLSQMGLTKDELLKPLIKGNTGSKEKVQNKEVPIVIANNSIRKDKPDISLFEKL